MDFRYGGDKPSQATPIVEKTCSYTSIFIYCVLQMAEVSAVQPTDQSKGILSLILSCQALVHYLYTVINDVSLHNLGLKTRAI